MLTELDISTVWRRLRPGPTVLAGIDGDTPAMFVYSENLFRYQTIYRRCLVRYILRGVR